MFLHNCGIDNDIIQKFISISPPVTTVEELLCTNSRLLARRCNMGYKDVCDIKTTCALKILDRCNVENPMGVTVSNELHSSGRDLYPPTGYSQLDSLLCSLQAGSVTEIIGGCNSEICQIGTSFAVTCAGIGLSVMIVAVGKGAEVEKRLLATATRDILQQGEAERALRKISIERVHSPWDIISILSSSDCSGTFDVLVVDDVTSLWSPLLFSQAGSVVSLEVLLAQVAGAVQQFSTNGCSVLLLHPCPQLQHSRGSPGPTRKIVSRNLPLWHVWADVASISILAEREECTADNSVDISTSDAFSFSVL